MMTVAITMPRSTAGNAFLNLTPRREAIREPVQAPVPGSGIPTKSTSPQNSYFSICPLLPMALFSSFSTRGRKSLVCFSQLKIGVIRSRIKGTGMIFPITQNQIARTMSISRSDATTSPPRSSRIGTMETMKTIISLEILPPSVSINQVIILSIFYLSFL